MGEESCNSRSSRSLSWLVKSCLPDPTATIPGRRRPNPPPSPAYAISLSSLPEDLLLECLSRVPLSSLPSLFLVCRRFSRLLNSPHFLLLRRSRGLLRRTLFTLAISGAELLVSAAAPLSGAVAWTQAAPPLPSLPAASSFSNPRLVPIGRSIFLLGRRAAVRYDPWTGAAAVSAPTLFPRKKFAAAAIGGKIYVAGGSSRTSAVEEYDPATDAWRVVAEAPRRRYGCVGAAAHGVFFIIGGLKVDGDGESRLDAYTYAGTMDLYDVQGKTWTRARAVPGGGCVVAACAAGDRIYAVASHAVEVSFWRWEGWGKRRSDGEGGCGWARLATPPMPPPARIGRAGRFACVGVGDSTVILMAHVAGESSFSGTNDGERLVLMYDAVGGRWTRGNAVPPALWRLTCVCVEC